MKEWLAECKRLNVTITSEKALAAIATFYGLKQPGSQTLPRPQFTSESFINALAEFIVATDQVCLKYFCFIYY